MGKFNISRLFDNKTFLKTFSIILAVIVWGIVTLTTKNDSQRTLRDVPIDFSVTGTAVEALGLSPFEHSKETIDIKLSGARGELNRTSEEDFDVTLSLGHVTNSGRYTLSIDVNLKDTNKNITIVDYSPKSIEVNFDRIATKNIEVTTRFPNISAKDGYMLDKGYSSSPEITVSGPESIVEKITSCVADITDKKTGLEKSLTVSNVPLKLYSEKNEITSSDITMDKTSVNVTIPVLKIKDLPVKVHLLNTPSGFDASNFKYSLSSQVIKIAHPVDVQNPLSQIDLHMDLKKVKPGDTVTLDVELPAGYLNIDNISTVDITIPDKDLSEKKFTVKNITPPNVPGKNVNVVTKQLNNVIVVGTKDVLDNLKASDIVVEVDLTDTAISSGTMTVPATIKIPSASGIFWVYGDYPVSIKS